MSNQDDNDTNGDKKNNITAFPGKKQRKKIHHEKIRVVEVGNSNIKNTQNQPIFNIPPVSKMLILSMIATFIVFLVGEKLIPNQNWLEIRYFLSFVPSRYMDFNNLGVDALISPITYMFLHGGIFHLLINVAILVAIGSGFERAIGGKKMLMIFFITGLTAALIHFAFYMDSNNPVLGASGGISGLFGAFLLQQKMHGLMGPGYKKLGIIVVAWSSISVIFGLTSSGEDIAWTAHLGGFWSGLLLYKPILKSKIGK